MKKQVVLFSLLVTMLTTLFPIAALAQQSGLINWQKNGDLNAFLYGDVDSITYSKVDLDGRVHTNVVVQEVWKQDSVVYRMPLANIDSVTFKAPAPVYNNGVFHFRDFHYPYVTEVTGLTVTLDASIPSDSLPVVGQVVVSDRAYEAPFIEGFAGRVINLIRSGNEVRIECEDVILEDIYDELLDFGKTVVISQNNESNLRAPRRIEYLNEGEILWDLGTVSLELVSENDSNYLSLEINPFIDIDYTVRISKKRGNLFRVIATDSLVCQLNAGHKFINKDFVKWEKFPGEEVPGGNGPGTFLIPTSVPLLFLKVSLGGYFNLNGTGSISASLPFTLVHHVGYDSQNDGGVFNFKGTRFETPSLDVNLNAEVSGGLAVKFSTCFIADQLASIKFKVFAGPSASLDLNFNSAFDYGPSLYNFKDSKISLAPLTATVSGGVTIAGKDIDLEYTFPHKKYDYYLFPDFTKPALPGLDNSNISLTALTTSITRNLIFPVRPGIGLYQNDQLKYKHFSTKEYKREDKWNKNDLQMELRANYPIGTYIAKPIFEFLGGTIPVDSISTVTIPDTLSFPNKITVKNGETKYINVDGGWGSYTLSNNDSSSIKATFVPSNSDVELGTSWPPTNIAGYENESPRVKITGLKNTNTQATLAITDVRPDTTISTSVNVNDTGLEPIIQVSPVKMNCETVIWGDTPSYSNATFTVTGNNLVGDISLESSDEAIFQVAPKKISPIQGTVDTCIVVTYHPQSTGSHSAIIKISSSGADSRIVKVTGECVYVNVTPSSWDFETVVKGYNSSKTFTVDTQGVTGNISLSSNNANFKLNKTSLGSNGGSFTVTYEPSSVGSHLGIITVSVGGVIKTVSLNGKCEAGYITVSPNPLDFGSALIPGKSYSKSFTVTTNVPGTLSSSSNSGNGEFTVPTQIKTGSNSVGFKSDKAGDYSGVINIQDTKSGASAQLMMKAKVVATITVTPASWDFGTVVKGYNSKKTFTVTAQGVSGNISLSSNNSKFKLDKSSLSSSGGTFDVTYDPGAVGTHSATITIEGGGTTVSVPLNGKCEAGYITVSPNPLDFGSVLIPGKSYSKSFTVTTNVPGTLSSSSNSGNGEFTVPTQIKTGSNSVGFKSDKAGDYSGVINIQDTKSGASAQLMMKAKVVSSISANSLSFSSQNYATPQDLSIQCVGANSPLTLSVSGNTGLFIGLPSNGTSISQSDANKGKTYSISCKPSILNKDTASVTIVISGGGANSKTVYVNYKKNGGVSITTTRPDDIVVKDD